MKTNQAGVNLIKQSEGLRLRAYVCPAGVWTIGYGHTGPDVTAKTVISAAQAEALLVKDLERFERDVLQLLNGHHVTENQFAALVSFSYNVGSDIDADTKAEGLGDSTLLKKLLKGDNLGAADEFLKWTHGGGKVLPGLVKRRAAERALFLLGLDEPIVVDLDDIIVS